MWQRLRNWARTIKRDVLMLWLAARDPRTPIWAKLLAGLVAAYALSPIDLIPDIIPILGYLDDVLLVPVGIWIAVKMIPASLATELRAEAALMAGRPVSRGATVAVGFIWIALAVAAAATVLKR